MSEWPIDWLTFLKEQAGKSCPEVNLRHVRPRDRLLIVTRNTRYLLEMLEAREAIVSTDRMDRPAGKVRIMGCTFGLSSTIKPDHLFCGGSLEFTFDAGKMRHTTSTVAEIHWLHSEPEETF